jgi:glycosyltransferase involved in cell wall biosynthesis
MPDPNDRPRVLHVITRLNIGGPARHVLALLPGLRERGFDTLVAFGTPEPDEGELTPGPDEPSFRIVALRRPIDPASDQRAITELTRLAARYRPDVVHTHMAKGGALGRSVARRVKARAVVHTFHGHVLEGYFASPANSAFVIAERRLARRTDALIAVSDSTRDDLLELGIGTPERWHVLPLALDLDPLLELEMPRDEARAWLDLPEGVPAVGIVGRLVPIKNHVLFLEAAVQIAAERPETVFVVAGDGELRSMLEAEAARSLGGRIRFLGWTQDLAALYAALDVVMSTSLSEGTPVALIEALAAARPVVATDVGGVSEVVAHGRNGFLAASGDAVGLARAALDLLGHAELRRSMGAAGREDVAERYQASRIAGRTADLYERLLAR